MTIQVNHRNPPNAAMAPRVARISTAAAVVAMPAAGFHVMWNQFPQSLSAPTAPMAAAVGAYAMQAVIAAITPRSRQGGVWAGALAALVGGLLLAAVGAAPRPELMMAGWLIGTLAAFLLHAATEGAAGQAPIPHPFRGALCLAVSAAMIAATAHLAPWFGVGTMVAVTPGPLAVLGVYALTASECARRATVWRSRPHMAGEGVVLGLAVGLGVSVAFAFPEIDTLGLGGTALVTLIATMSMTISSSPALRLTAALSAVATAPLAATVLIEGTPRIQFITGGLSIAVLVASLWHPGSKSKKTPRGLDVPAAIQTLVQQAGGAWPMRMDVARRTVSFPAGVNHVFGVGQVASFSEFFADSDLSGMLNLMRALHLNPPPADRPVAMRILSRSDEATAGLTREARPYALHILTVERDIAWLCAVRCDGQTALENRAQHYEQLLAEAVLREERLLSVASHELRTPVAILSMLAEEMGDGMPWAEIEPGFAGALDRIMAVLDDLRAGGTEGGLAATAAFTQREMLEDLLDAFRPAAAANGIELHSALSQQADLPLCSDRGRAFIALSKLLHNAIIHSHGQNVTISGFLSQTGANGLTVTWQVADDGVGISPADRERVFEPFETAAGHDGAHPGLGLYTARNAMRLMGGDLVLQDEGSGCRLVLSHPARMATATRATEPKEMTMSDKAPAFPGLGALLVEDNRLVGEITANRLRKLFARVRWAENGTDGLTMYREERPDILIVDQRMPGMNGSDLVRCIREADADLPIVGITASAMGSECRDLEEAGVDMALEKPVSFGQLGEIAAGFFGSPPQSS